MCATTHETMRGVNAIWGNSQSLRMVNAAFYYVHHLCDALSARARKQKAISDSQNA